MARRRYLPPEQDLVHVSFKCVGDAFLMRPDGRASFVIASALGVAVAKYGVRVHAFAFLSNHAHLLLGVRGCRLDAFMQLLKGRIALALNAERGRDGAFFKRRYRCEPILSTEAAVGLEQYVHQQAVAHELVERAVEWPGLCSYGAVVEGRDRVEAKWLDEVGWREAGGRPRDRGAFLRTASVPLSPLPHRVGLSEQALRAQRCALARNMRDAEGASARARRERGARRLPEPSRYARQDPNARPGGSRRKDATPQPMAHGRFGRSSRRTRG